MSEVYPDADIVCLWNDSTGRFPPERLRESWLARSPLRRSKAAALPFMPATWRRQQEPRLRLGADQLAPVCASRALLATAAGLLSLRLCTYPGSIYLGSRPGRPRAASGRPDGGSCAEAARPPAGTATGNLRSQQRLRPPTDGEAWGVEAQVIYPPVDVTEIQRVDDWTTQLTAEESEIIGHAAGRLPVRRFTVRSVQATGPGHQGR